MDDVVISNVEIIDIKRYFGMSSADFYVGKLEGITVKFLCDHVEDNIRLEGKDIDLDNLNDSEIIRQIRVYVDKKIKYRVLVKESLDLWVSLGFNIQMIEEVLSEQLSNNKFI